MALLGRIRAGRRSVVTLAIAAAMLMSMAGAALAEINNVTPSTNDINRTNGWAHVDLVATNVGSVDVEFISTRGFLSCFEYRADGDLTQSSGDNYNTDITDGLYPFTCVSNETFPMTLSANEYVEVRMVFGAETDERFDWTRFDVLPAPTATTKDDCKSGGWETYGFKNQGQCIASIVANDNAEPHN